jgi:hypothetical protein
MKDELKIMYKKAVIICFNLSQNLPRGNRKNYKNLVKIT